MVAASGANATVACPQCGQAIIVPSPAPAMVNPERIIPGAKTGDGPAPKVPERRAVAAKKKSPVAMLVALVVLTCLVGAVLFAFRENIFKSAKAPAKAVSASNTGAPPRPVSMPVVEVPPYLPLPEGTNYWTLDVKAVRTPDATAGGMVHGKMFTAEEMHLNSDGLTLRTPQLPPEAGVTIYLYPNPIESLYGKSLLYESNTPGAPGVFLRWKGATEMKYNGYSLRLEFGNPEGDHIAGKIYLCTDDQMKSYVVGKFYAKIYKP